MNNDPSRDPCTCGHMRIEHADNFGQCQVCEFPPCPRYTWAPPKKEEKEEEE